MVAENKKREKNTSWRDFII